MGLVLDVRLWDMQGLLASCGHVQLPECFVCFSLRDCSVGLEDVTRLCQILAQCPQLTEIE